MILENGWQNMYCLAMYSFAVSQILNINVMDTLPIAAGYKSTLMINAEYKDTLPITAEYKSNACKTL